MEQVDSSKVIQHGVRATHGDTKDAACEVVVVALGKNVYFAQAECPLGKVLEGNEMRRMTKVA